jgi:hypothetical protein
MSRCTARFSSTGNMSPALRAMLVVPPPPEYIDGSDVIQCYNYTLTITRSRLIDKRRSYPGDFSSTKLVVRSSKMFFVLLMCKNVCTYITYVRTSVHISCSLLYQPFRNLLFLSPRRCSYVRRQSAVVSHHQTSRHRAVQKRPALLSSSPSSPSLFQSPRRCRYRYRCRHRRRIVVVTVVAVLVPVTAPSSSSSSTGTSRRSSLRYRK